MESASKPADPASPRKKDWIGYRVSGTHANPLGIKTDAPFHLIWDIVRAWVAEHPVKPQEPSSYAAKILAKEPEHKANFSRAAGSISKAQTQKVARYPGNPEPNWGPRPKHGRFIKEADNTTVGGIPAQESHQHPQQKSGVTQAIDDHAVGAPT